MTQMGGDGEIDAAQYITAKELNEIVEAHGRHGLMVTYDDVGKKDLQEGERTITRRVRNAMDKRVWDLLRGDREWAWKVICICNAMFGNGTGFAISKTEPSGGGGGGIESGALYLAFYAQWWENAESKGLIPQMCVDVFWSGYGWGAVARKHGKHYYKAKQMIEQALDLMLDMRGEAKLQSWRYRQLKKGLQAGIENGMFTTDHAIAVDGDGILRVMSKQEREAVAKQRFELRKEE